MNRERIITLFMNWLFLAGTFLNGAMVNFIIKQEWEYVIGAFLLSSTYYYTYALYKEVNK